MDFSEDCCNVQGGQIDVIIDGVPYSTTGDVVINPARYTSDALANNDLSMSITKEPRVPDAEITFRSHCDFDARELTEACTIDVTIRQPLTKKRFLFPKAAIVGEPAQNLQSGEVSGLRIASPYYDQKRI